MKRKIIEINEAKCNGCGLCAGACHEGAIGMVNGKAKLLREDFCDGLGDCLPQCPTGAITFVYREAPAYNEVAVRAAKSGGCPGSASHILHPSSAPTAGEQPSRLQNFPVQIKLVNPMAPWLRGAELLLAADCTAYCYGGFHRDFLAGRVLLIACPKLDGIDYSEKLAEILSSGQPKSLTLVRMEVPCCGGLVHAAKKAIATAGTGTPLRVVTISIDGKILEEEQL